MSFTSAYFHDEVLRLREAFGTRTFWKNPENERIAAKALGHVYVGLAEDPTEQDELLFITTLDELARRGDTIRALGL